MKPQTPILTVLVLLSFHLSFSVFAQNLRVDGEAAVGSPGSGNVLLTLNSERNWAFRQFSTGSNTALELADLTGLKNFIVNTTGNMGVGTTFPTDKLHVTGNIRATGTRIYFGSSEYFEDGGGFIINCNGSLNSVVDGADDLGSGAKRWRNVWATSGIISTSDLRMKSDIRDLSYGLKEILQLHPVSFAWKEGPERGAKLGLIAQEVQEVIREVVVDHEFRRSETSDDWERVPTPQLGLYYSDLIPVLIRGIQEQQQLIEEKERRIVVLEAKVQELADLEQRLAALEQLRPQKVTTDVILQGGHRSYLQQNVPNPFSVGTSIAYLLPENVQRAFLRITDAGGKVLKMVQLENTSQGHINLTAYELPAGTYTYTLIVDGKPLESKMMVLTK